MRRRAGRKGGDDASSMPSSKRGGSKGRGQPGKARKLPVQSGGQPSAAKPLPTKQAAPHVDA